jgi:hypothetical protein
VFYDFSEEEWGPGKSIVVPDCKVWAKIGVIVFWLKNSGWLIRRGWVRLNNSQYYKEYGDFSSPEGIWEEDGPSCVVTVRFPPLSAHKMPFPRSRTINKKRILII